MTSLRQYADAGSDEKRCSGNDENVHGGELEGEFIPVESTRHHPKADDPGSRRNYSKHRGPRAFANAVDGRDQKEEKGNRPVLMREESRHIVKRSRPEAGHSA